MDSKIMVEVFYGKYEEAGQFGVAFYFDTYKDAENFIKIFIKDHSYCNAKITKEYIYGD